MNACPKVAGPATLVAKMDAPEGGILMMEGNYTNINLAHMVFTRDASSGHASALRMVNPKGTMENMTVVNCTFSGFSTKV